MKNIVISLEQCYLQCIFELNIQINAAMDELNQDFILSSTFTELLLKIVKGEIDTKELAKRELENRGLNINGKWVGFGKKITQPNLNFSIKNTSAKGDCITITFRETPVPVAYSNVN